uniref:alpha/beta family hydrolase n=1 Tax=Kribbia dieselivorans TaxID=331526 RepID=UPI000A89FF3C
DAVLALAFPLHPPGKPEKSRAPELLAPVEAGLPVHVIQGETDAFGAPAEVKQALGRGRARLVSAVPGPHGFAPTAGPAVVRAAARFLETL